MIASAVTLVVVVAVGICFEALDVNRRGVLEFSEFEKANTDYIADDIADGITNGTIDGIR